MDVLSVMSLVNSSLKKKEDWKWNRRLSFDVKVLERLLISLEQLPNLKQRFVQLICYLQQCPWILRVETGFTTHEYKFKVISFFINNNIKNDHVCSLVDAVSNAKYAQFLKHVKLECGDKYFYTFPSIWPSGTRNIR